MEDVLWQDATGQAELIASGQVSAREMVSAAIARIEEVDGRLNAVIHRRFEQALAEVDAGLPAGPFHGVPFLIKDLSADSAGDPAHNGNRALRDAGVRAEHDSWLVARFRQAGFAFVGRTNTPEFGLVPVTESHAYGPCRNPYDPAYSPGGSSGGSASAVAAGMVAVAHASDGGGSIRIPASMCGLIGLKPSRGRTTLGPHGIESNLSVQNVVARSLRDVAAVLDAIQGPGPGDAVVAPPPLRPYAAEVGTRPPQLRIGLLDFSPSGTDLDPECVTAVRDAGRLLESLGHVVGPEHPDIDAEAGRRFGIRWAVNARVNLRNLGTQLGREVTPDDVEPLTWAMAAAAEPVSGTDYAEALAASAQFTRRLAQFWVDHDLLVTPTLGQLPPRIGELEPPPGDPFVTQARTGALVPFTTHFNVTGQPAISLPLHVSAAGLPVGVHLVAAYGREDLLIQVAAQLEEAAPWSGRRPAI
ncbi:MAG TPA: amidase family protein [Acidimicrobiales bacterium]|jgi:amidase|nr:amidase family protein [Acidimicrobiales bacterium]